MLLPPMSTLCVSQHKQISDAEVAGMVEPGPPATPPAIMYVLRLSRGAWIPDWLTGCTGWLTGVVCRLRGLTKVWENGVLAVNNTNLNMYEGQVFALLGHNVRTRTGHSPFRC